MKYRPHRDSHELSMSQVQEFKDADELVDLLNVEFEEMGPHVFKEALSAQPYVTLGEWNVTYLVRLDDYGVCGYTDGPVLGLKEEPWIRTS